jgi:hypothetical protein
MISTKYYDNRSNDVIQLVRSGAKRESATVLPTVTKAVLHRWMQSVSLCRSAECSLC